MSHDWSVWMKRLLAILLVILLLGLVGCEIDEDMDIRAADTVATARADLR
jgi:hypothetical protein